MSPLYARSGWRLWVFWGLLGVVLVNMAVTGYVAHEGEQARAAVCAYRQSLAASVQQSEAYLRMSPAERRRRFGKALAGVPRSTILTGISHQEATLRALDGLACGGPF